MSRRFLTLQPLAESQCGQGLVEMALVGVVLVLILSGVIDLGRAYFAYIAVADAATEGAAYGATFSDRSESEITERVVRSSGGGVSIDPNLVSVVADTQSITVTVAYTQTLITPLIQTLVGEEAIVLRQRAVQPILE
jgi:hypothetical protein